jgi:TetR/AcrR family transcriptional regulator, transcriptional repressor for nem operon
MSHPPRYREQVRQRIIESAALLFNRHGFTAVSIDDIMAGAGLTRGGFYGYFQSKGELYAEAINRFVNDSQHGTDAAENAKDHAAQIVRDFLSLHRIEGAATHCPLLGLANDLSRTDPSVRVAQESALRMMIETFERGVTPSAQPARQRALALASLCVGGMALARTIEDRSLGNELREAAMAIALKLGHWG